MSWLRDLFRAPERHGSAPTGDVAVDRETAERTLSAVLSDDQEVAELSATLRERERQNHLGPMIMRALRGEGA